ncbi:MAG: class III poly(R)-hydroxyalkanoic acid synthase subunit PhaE [Chloroflexaceae bacterium]|nr:class III poly(R)-hydroxyalkanoic acid synthase subunit PhaE [Chloroflexaceae bacterium]
MTWTEQANNLMNVWSEAQKSMWQGWYDAMQNASTPPTLMNPAVLEQWRTMANQSMGMWQSSAEPIAKTVSNQFVASQAAMMRLLEYTTRAWNAMAPKMDAGQDWQTAMNEYMEQFRKQMLSNPQSIFETTQETTQLWQMYMQQMQQVSQPWVEVLQQMPVAMSGMMSGSGSSSLIEMSKLYQNAYARTFGSLTTSPGFGITRELEEKVDRATSAWQRMQQGANNYQVLMADAWSGVFEQVMETLVKRAEQGQPIESLRDLARLWTDSADRSFDRVFRTEEYANVQAEFVTATMEYRLAEQAVVEYMMQLTYIPTRSEMDEAHRNIYALRKEVKALKKALRQMNGKSAPAAKPAPAPAAAAPKPAPAKEPGSTS